MSSTLDATIFVHPDTKVTTQVWRDANVGLIAIARWEGLTIHFAPDVHGGIGDIAEACDVLIAAIEQVRAQVLPEPLSPDPEAARDDRIDAGLGTGYIGEFTR